LLTGYAGWRPGQLDSELSASAWLTANADIDIIFETQSSDMWDTALRRLGAEPSSLQTGSGSVH
jgi:putative transcriptional regulator